MKDKMGMIIVIACTVLILFELTVMIFTKGVSTKAELKEAFHRGMIVEACRVVDRLGKQYPKILEDKEIVKVLRMCEDCPRSFDEWYLNREKK